MDYYNTISSSYNELHGEEQLQKLRIIKEHLTPGKKILDVGCGTGLSSILGDVTGVEPSEELAKQCSFPVTIGSAESLDFVDHSFAIVISVTALHHCTDIGKALREIKRVGKDEFAFSILKKAQQFSLIQEEIEKHFVVKETIDEGKDMIFFCQRRESQK